MESSSSSNGPPPQEESKRSKVRGKMQNPGHYGEKGEVRQTTSGAIEWKGPKDSWVPAVYHNSIRQNLLAEASNNGARSYHFPREKGEAPFDETAFHPDQEEWNPNRANWDTIEHDILHKIRRPDGRGKYADIALSNPWIWQDRVVIDRENQPLREVPGLPVTISSNIEAWLSEAWMRIDARVTKRDVWQRLPDQILRNGHLEPIYTPNKLSNDRFRKLRGQEGLPAWDVRGREDWRQRYLLDRIPDAARQANSTRDVPPLTAEERKELAALGEKNGRSLKKAQGRNTAAALETRQANSEQPTNQIAAAPGSTGEAGSGKHPELHAGSDLGGHGGTTSQPGEANSAARTDGSWQHPQDLTASPPPYSNPSFTPFDAGQSLLPPVVEPKNEYQGVQPHLQQSLDAPTPSSSRQPNVSEQQQLRETLNLTGQTSSSTRTPSLSQSHSRQDTLQQGGKQLGLSQAAADFANTWDIPTSPKWNISFEVNGRKFTGKQALEAARVTQEIVSARIGQQSSLSNQSNDQPPQTKRPHREESILHASSSLSSTSPLQQQQSVAAGLIGQFGPPNAPYPYTAGRSNSAAAHAGLLDEQRTDQEQRSIAQPGLQHTAVPPNSTTSREPGDPSASQVPGPNGLNIDFNAHITDTSVHQDDRTDHSTRRKRPLPPYQSLLPQGTGEMPRLFEDTMPSAQQARQDDGPLSQLGPPAINRQRPTDHAELQRSHQDVSFGQGRQHMPIANTEDPNSSRRNLTQETHMCSNDNENLVQQEQGNTRSSNIEVEPTTQTFHQLSNSLTQAHQDMGTSNTQRPLMTSNKTTAGVQPETTEPNRTDHAKEGDAGSSTALQDAPLQNDSRLPNQDTSLEGGPDLGKYEDSGLEFPEFDDENFDLEQWTQDNFALFPNLTSSLNSNFDASAAPSSIFPVQDLSNLETMLEQSHADMRAREQEQDRQDDLNAASLNPNNKQARDCGSAMDSVVTDPITGSSKKKFSSSMDHYNSWQDPESDPTLTDGLVTQDEGMVAITPQPLTGPSQSRSLERQASHLPTPPTTGNKRKRDDDDGDPEERQDPASPSPERKRPRHEGPENVRGQNPPPPPGKKRAREENPAGEEQDRPVAKRRRAG